MRRIFAGIFVLCLILIGCAASNQAGAPSTTAYFTSKEYSFSFTYPSGWSQNAQDLPNKWAIVDEDQDAILFTVNQAPVGNLALLGNLQAVRDLYETNNQSGITQEKMEAISKIVKLKKYTNAEFYTYAIDFADKEVQSIVSGTLCNGREVTIVLVAHNVASSQKTQLYEGILDSFTCSA